MSAGSGRVAGENHVVGTAGHIDHGKSTLIHALTGIDPDRLAEEKRRGMTIDLGFAHLALPSGREVGVVDVPGHARFVHNMLAGVHGIDAVILVVAADEGVMPQTREHLEIVDLLEIRRGLVALTKSDLVDTAWIEMVSADVAGALDPTSLRGAPILPVSAVAGTGLEKFVRALDRVLAGTPPRADLGHPRLPVDRVFTVAGFGTVVTGTLTEGRLEVGDEVQLQPGGRRARVRGLQQHGRRVEAAGPGSRVAANLSGIDRAELRRGDVVARPGALAPTRRVDTRLRMLQSSPRDLKHGEQLVLHTGTSEVPARAIVLGPGPVERGASGWVQLYLGRPVAIAAGDRFVVRLPSPAATIGGGVAVDPHPRRHHRLDPSVPASLARRVEGAALQEELRKYPRGVTEEALLAASPAGAGQLAALDAHRAGRLLFAPEAWARLAERAAAAVAGYHQAHPLRPGIPREELRSRLGLPAPALGPLLAELEGDGVVIEREGVVASPGHAAAGRPDLGGPGRRLLDVLGAEPFAPPSFADALRDSGATPEIARALARSGHLVRLSDEIWLTRPAYDAALAAVRELAERDGEVTVAGLRDRLRASRRPVLAMLEHLDSERVTRRVGDARVLR